MADNGAHTFIEVGPKRVLNGLISQILDDTQHAAISLDKGNTDDNSISDIADALAQLAAIGHAVDLSAWCPHIASEAPTERKGMVIPLCGANHVDTREPLPPRPKKPQPKPATQPTHKTATTTAVQKTASAPQTHSISTHQTTPAMNATSISPMQTPAPNSQPQAVQPTQAAPAIQALQHLMHTTSQLHQQFLSGQQEAVQALMQLQGLAPTAPAAAPSTPVAPLAAPAPVPAVSAPAAPVAVAPQAAAPVTAAPVPATPPAPAAAPTPDPVATQAPAPESKTPAPVANDNNNDALADDLLAVVAEKTGYPADMIGLEMDIDAELGIDSIKRVEILAALQEMRPDLPSVQPDELGRLRTLGEVLAAVQPESASASAWPRANDNKH